MGISSLPQLYKLDADTCSLGRFWRQSGYTSITTRGTRDEELDLVKVSPIREAEQEKGTPFPNKYLKCRMRGKQLHDLEEYLEPKDKISTA